MVQLFPFLHSLHLYDIVFIKPLAAYCPRSSIRRQKPAQQTVSGCRWSDTGLPALKCPCVCTDGPAVQVPPEVEIFLFAGISRLVWAISLYMQWPFYLLVTLYTFNLSCIGPSSIAWRRMAEWMYRSTFYSRVKTPVTQWIGGWVAPRTDRSGRREDRKYLSLPGLELRPPQSPSP
jgi:hypothetical protein